MYMDSSDWVVLFTRFGLGRSIRGVKETVMVIVQGRTVLVIRMKGRNG